MGIRAVCMKVVGIKVVGVKHGHQTKDNYIDKRE